jgi:DNA topoisomerase-1
MSGKYLVIVESPTKAKTITKFLGKEYVVKASNGHIRDLPNNASEVPAKLKKEPWAKIGVNVAQDFDPLYVIPKSKKEHVESLKAALKDAKFLYLATDEDREGESISWHLVETLKPKVPMKRLVFHEITKEAIKNSLDTAREIDQNLVRAQETRRIIDRLFGYEVSPLLWKKMSPGLSAGRVQSVAIRLLVERERERIRFRSADYWGIKAVFNKRGTEQTFEAELTHVGEKRIATGKDFDPEKGTLVSPDSVVLLDSVRAEALKSAIAAGKAHVASVEEKPYTQSPSAPFVTSTLQQEGNRKLRYSAKRTMSIAQQLYENGYITYMRTDSTTLSEQALTAARNLIAKDFGKEFLPNSPRTYATKVKNAQEAHEAIRPAGDSFTHPDIVKEALGEDAFRLYDLIWKRTVASQMTDAKGTYINVNVTAGEGTFRASGKTITQPGFLRAYVEGSDDPEAELADREKILPKLANGEEVGISAVDPSSHTTQPPPRFTEGSLIKELERLGIGRPSTWATIVDLVLNRSYAFKKGNALVPTFVACAVVGLLERHFTYLTDYEFTARLEDDLDAISRGEAQNVEYLRSFYFGNGHPGFHNLVEKGEKEIDPRVVCGLAIDSAPGAGEQKLEVRIGRYGPFVSDGTRRASVPDDFPPDELNAEVAEKLLADAAKGPESLGIDPVSGLQVYVKVGRFGPYLQLGEPKEGEKPKMASLLAGMTPSDVSLEQALKILSLPRDLGPNPLNGEAVIAANGRFGPYIKCGTETRSIPAGTNTPIDITLEQALELLAQPKRNSRAPAKAAPLKEIGKHPASGAAIQLMSGRYGPYVTDGTTNASVPRGTDPMSLSLEAAVELIKDREGKAPVKKTRRKKAKS